MSALLLALSCGAPADPNPPHPAPPPREVKLRAVTGQWSGDLLGRSDEEIEALLADLPPKYRPAVRAYIDALKKQAREKR